METIDDPEQFTIRWIEHHSTYVIPGELARRKMHVTAVDRAKSGWMEELFQPVHRKREDPTEQDKLNRLTGSSPLIAWDIILRVIAKTSDPAILFPLSCPFELLLARHGPAVIADVEERARTDRRFMLFFLLTRDTIGPFLKHEGWSRDGALDVYERVMAI